MADSETSPASEFVAAGPARERLRRLRAEERERAEPLPGLPDPDRWSRAWILGASIALVVGGLLPVPDWEAILFGGGSGDPATYLWPWEILSRSDSYYRWTGYRIWLPFAWALAGIASLGFHGARRAAVVLFGVLAAFVADWIFGAGPYGETRWAAGLAVTLGALGVAVGNHLRKRTPAGRLPTRLAGFGGLLCLLALLLPNETFVPDHTLRGGGGPSRARPWIGFYFVAGEWERAWPMLLFGLLFVVFAVTGVRAFRRTDVSRRCGRTSRLARMLLVGFPLAYFGLCSLQDYLRWMSFPLPAAIALRGSTLAIGGPVLLGTGLVLGIEIRCQRRLGPARAA